MSLTRKEIRKKRLEGLIIIILSLPLSYYARDLLATYTVYNSDRAEFPYHPFNDKKVLKNVLNGKIYNESEIKNFKNTLDDFHFYISLEDLENNEKKDKLVSRLDEIIVSIEKTKSNKKD